ncbi:SGNH/GDSL hydrolase family protein [Piscirickettsia salmonis]|uniref:SGNH/GDSL hydrolase family protein n=2 Tax=Piscirickettsia salmonis TaxID=1238 RepID=UPI0012BAE5D3|nr:SGNH/GDSL hydrolase family protein [Piscirickettsia salmonis]QGP60563.1 Phosphatidylcholine-sterol acyltransferase precursor [Piscirickettsia salmonis]
MTLTDSTHPSSNPLGSLTFTLDNGLLANHFDINQQTGQVASDNTSMEWHSWYGTPNVTLSTCPQSLDISQSDLLKDVSRVIIFGDSLSDKGTLFEYSQGIIPSAKAYYNGMFSNSDVWAKLLENHLNTYHNKFAQNSIYLSSQQATRYFGKLPLRVVMRFVFFRSKLRGIRPLAIDVSNYAVGGATAVLNSDLKHLPYSLNSENSAFNTNALEKNWPAEDYKHFLAIIFIGANDYLTLPKDMSAQAKETLTTQVVNSIKEEVDKLMSKGVQKFVFINLPDLALTPESRDDLQNTQTTHYVSERHNEKLYSFIQDYKNNYGSLGDHFELVDLYPLFNTITQPTSNEFKQLIEKYHLKITNTTDSCWNGGYTVRSQQSMNSNNYRSAIFNAQPSLPRNSDILVAIQTATSGTMCSDPEHYIFWDRVHPTKQVQQILYQTIVSTLGAKVTTSV